MQDKDPQPGAESNIIDSAFLTNAFIQSKNIPSSNQVRPGKHFHSLKPIYEDENAVLNYVLKNVKPAMMKQALLAGSYDTPPYHQQEGPLTCNLAVFRMIFESITGQKVSEKDIYSAAKATGLLKETMHGDEGDLIRIINVDPPHLEDLLKIFKTEVFRRQFPQIEAGTIPIMGADFEDFQKAAEEIRPKLGEDAQLFLALSIESEVVKSQLHQIIVLSAGDGFVTVHDPSNAPGTGGANKKIPVEKFIERYGKGKIRGDIIASRKKQL